MAVMERVMYGFDRTFDTFASVFGIVFIIVIGIFVVTAVRGISGWHKNNNSPRLTVAAAVVAKRMDVTYYNHTNEGMRHGTSSTWYYVTFQVLSGDRMELPVSGAEYGMLAEGDVGELTFQGTRYVSFVRKQG